MQSLRGHRGWIRLELLLLRLPVHGLRFVGAVFDEGRDEVEVGRAGSVQLLEGSPLLTPARALTLKRREEGNTKLTTRLQPFK